MLRIQDPPKKEKADAVGQELDELAREGARRMLMQALDAEVADYIERHQDPRDEEGHALVVRNGRARQRRVTLGRGDGRGRGASSERQVYRERRTRPIYE